MSNHFSAAMLKFPGDDPRLDLTNGHTGRSRLGGVCKKEEGGAIPQMVA